jgi:signal transduction histidine kinase
MASAGRARRRPADAVSDSSPAGDRLLALTEEELQRIVLDVHDGPVQYLFAALAQLTALRGRLAADSAPPAYSTPLARATESVEAALADIRRTVSAFRAPTLAEHGLTGVIEELVVGHEARTGSSVELILDPAVSPVSLPATIALYRIVQEALSNVDRHAGVKAARVRVWTADGRVCAEVSDEGCGFTVPALVGPNATELAAHIGLRGMRERMALVRGRLSVTSSPGGGTRILAEVPSDA